MLSNQHGRVGLHAGWGMGGGGYLTINFPFSAKKIAQVWTRGTGKEFLYSLEAFLNVWNSFLFLSMKQKPFNPYVVFVCM